MNSWGRRADVTGLAPRNKVGALSICSETTKEKLFWLSGRPELQPQCPHPQPIAHPAPRLPPPAHLQTLLPTSRGGRGVPLVSEDSAVSVSRRCARCLSTIQKRTLEPPLTVLFGYYSFFFCGFFFFAMHSIIEQNVPYSSPSPWWGGDGGIPFHCGAFPFPLPFLRLIGTHPGLLEHFQQHFTGQGASFDHRKSDRNEKQLSPPGRPLRSQLLLQQTGQGDHNGPHMG